jgi:predicted GIY-YIG superfamily endonuclease
MRDMLREKLCLHLDRLDLQRLVLRQLLDHVDTADETLLSRQLDTALTTISPFTITFEQGAPHVYVLRLADDCWYVGMSTCVEERIRCHFSGAGAVWTKTHRPLYVASIVRGDKDTERQITLDMMREKGWQYVRGSVWCAATLPKPPACL